MLLGIDINLCLCGSSHELLNLCLNLLSLRILFPVLPVIDGLPGRYDDIILVIIYRPEGFP